MKWLTILIAITFTLPALPIQPIVAEGQARITQTSPQAEDGTTQVELNVVNGVLEVSGLPHPGDIQDFKEIKCWTPLWCGGATFIQDGTQYSGRYL